MALLSKVDSDLSEEELCVYDKNGRALYRVRLDATHPVRKAGGASSMTMGDNVLFIRAGNTLFRLSGNGETVASSAISHDTLAILPFDGDELMVCTPAYAYRLKRADFEREG